MSVRLLIQVQQTIQHSYDRDSVTVVCSPVYPTASMPPEIAESIKQFYRSTPTGELRFTTVNKAAAEQMPLGSYHYVTIEPATT